MSAQLLCADCGSRWRMTDGTVVVVKGYAEGGRVHVCEDEQGERVLVPTPVFRSMTPC